MAFNVPTTPSVGSPVTAAQGSVIAADFSAMTFTAVTPSLFGSTTNPSGYTASGRWAVAGKIVVFHFQIIFAASIGSGNYSISLPQNAATSISPRTGIARGFDSSTGNGAYLMPAIASTSTVAFQYTATWLGALTNVGSTGPWTWAVNDILDGFIVYESV